ncbi:polyphenol oxidase family protein [Pseudactinotalea sp. HY160]|uniref:polyphenol oxidase family protein n=1 Tax=Pseudactinotalea sp. HY160 TaxID=2654490 RepID=UPI00351ADC91
MNNERMDGARSPRRGVVAVDLGPGVRAFFTTRAGGASGAGFAGLNLGHHVGDDPAAVRANRALVDAWAGAPVAYADQVHGVRVLDPARLPHADSRHMPISPGSSRPAGSNAAPPTGDAWCTASTTPVAIMVADCTPLLLADPEAGVVAAAHCGRAGLAAGVVPATLAAMIRAGAAPDRVRAAIGPGICGECYEVPASLRAEVSGVVPTTGSTTSWGTPAIDIPAGIRAQLAAAGVRDVTDTGLCTLTDERFFSYRRAAGTPTGRFAGVIGRL